MFNAFYAKLALANIRRDKRTYVPHIIATAVISGVYLLIAGLMFSYGLANLTSGKTTQAMFSFGMVVFSIFAFSVLITFTSSAGESAERIIRAVFPPIPETEINNRKISRSCFSANP